MQESDPNIAVIYQQAQQYDAIGDVYNAVKLYRRLLKLAPDWLPPYLNLAAIYKSRREWKPLLHYTKKAVALDASLQDVWWDLGIAAQALGKMRLARTVWSKFGKKKNQNKLVSLQLNHSGMFELIWATALDSVQAQIKSVPHPDSGLHFQDIVLFDRQVVGYQVANRRRYPVFPELGLVKRSFFRTYSCILESELPKDIRLLEKLCKESALGFEVWSNAARAKTIAGKKEYFDGSLFADAPMPLVAIAAKQAQEVEEVLAAWSVISLKSYTHFEDHG